MAKKKSPGRPPNVVAITKPKEFLDKSPMAKKVTLYKTLNGKFYVGGGRGRSKDYDSIAKIPKSAIDWVESTM